MILVAAPANDTVLCPGLLVWGLQIALWGLWVSLSASVSHTGSRLCVTDKAIQVGTQSALTCP